MQMILQAKTAEAEMMKRYPYQKRSMTAWKLKLQKQSK
jgi:hypothetical protein